MVERMTDMPPGVLGLRVSGRIERADYERVLEPELRAAVASGRVRALFVVERVAGIEPVALWADFKLFFEVGVRGRRGMGAHGDRHRRRVDGERGAGVRGDGPGAGARLPAV
jgi:SpoIIAA-like